MDRGEGWGNPCWPWLRAAASAAPWKWAARANGCPPWLCIISGCRKPFFGTRFGSYVGLGRTSGWAGMPGTMMGGFGDETGDRGGDPQFSRFSASLAGDSGAELSEKCTGECCGLAWCPPTIESMEKPIFGFDGTATTGVGARGIMVDLGEPELHRNPPSANR